MRELAAGFNFVRHELIKRGDTISQSKQQTMTRVSPPALLSESIFHLKPALTATSPEVDLKHCSVDGN